MRSRYRLMNESEEKDTDGEARPDILSFPIQNFNYTSAPLPFNLSESNIRRMDLTMYKYYGFADLDDLILQLSNIDSLNEVEAGTEVRLPSRIDLENFYFKYRKN